MLVKCVMICLFWVGIIVLAAKPVLSEQFSQETPLFYEGKLIDSLVIENRNIYDISDEKYNKFLFKTANKIHITTQKNIIKREVLLEKGEQFSQDLAEETARILRRRFVLYDAWIEKEIYENDKLLVRIVTIDRWSLSAGVNVRREGNENEIKIGLLEKNLFGQNKLISYHFISKSDDGSYSEASTVNNRLFGKKLVGKISLSTNPRNKFTLFLLEKPYYDLKQQFGFRVFTLNNKGRIDYYSNDSLISQNFYKGNRAESDFFYRFGSYSQKILLQLNYAYNYEKNNSDSLLPGSVQDTMYHAVKTGIGYSVYDYKKKQNIDGFNYTEDFNNGMNMLIYFQNVYSIKEFNKLYDVFNLTFRKNIITKNSLTTFQYVYKNWKNSSENIRTQFALNIKYYNQKVHNMVFAFNLDYRSDKSSQSIDLVNLGGTTGLRGIDKYFLTGDKRLVLNSEIRFLPTVSFLSFNFRMALFSDIGTIIHSGEAFKLSEAYTSFGTGLRIAFDRSSKNIIRLDFAYAQTKGWQLSFGTGQYFKALDQL